MSHGNRAIMRIVKGRGALACAAVMMFAGAAIGCGGSLTGNPGTGGTGGVPTGSSDSGRGGDAGTTGSAGASGTTGAAGSGALGDPACPTTVTKGAACLTTDVQLCYKTCGPEKTGVKSETCVGGVYAEMSGCSFDPAKDFSCYSVPSGTFVNTACPAGMPQASAQCDAALCTSCNSMQGAQGGMFLDSTGALKVGWCVCQAPNSVGLRTWSCASDTQWPCPLGDGCSPIFTGIGGVGGSSSGAGGAAGAGGASGAGGSIGQPACPGTVTKGGPCASTDAQLCYKTCGPESSGVKSDTCTGGIYAEMSGCAFDPSRDFSCYKIPATANAACGATSTPPIASGPCMIDACTLCNSTGGLPGGGYLDSSGAAKVGYCVCSASTRKWSCASDTAWPCPAGSGC